MLVTAMETPTELLVELYKLAKHRGILTVAHEDRIKMCVGVKADVDIVVHLPDGKDFEAKGTRTAYQVILAALDDYASKPAQQTAYEKSYRVAALEAWSNPVPF